MATTSTRTVAIVFTQASAPGFAASNSFAAASNSASPGVSEFKDLTSGANTITPPAGTSKACTIIPPANNAVAITLKGVTADTGIGLHLTDPTSIALASSTATFVLTVGANLAGMRLVWS